MATDTEAVQQRSSDEKSKIEVASYHDVAFEGTWRARSRGMWGVGALGLLAGAAIGALAPLFPVVVGATSLATAASLIPQTMAIFSATGIGMGVAAGTMVGSSSGAVGAVAKEQEKRLREAGIETPPGNDAQAQANEGKGFFTRFKEALGSLKINPKVMITFAALGAVAGVVMATAFLATGGAAAVPALGSLLGSAATSAPAVTAYFAGVMASFGALFGMNLPTVATQMTNVMGDTLGGKTINAPWTDKQAPSPEVQQAVEKAAAVEQPAPAKPEPATPRASKFQPALSYQEMMAQKAQEQSNELSLKS